MLQTVQSDDFSKTLDKHPSQKELIKSKLYDFIAFKTEHPANGNIPGLHPGYGSSDKRFSSEGNFTNKISDISHAHLTHNISIVYRIDGGILYLFGVYTHDEIGTGTPSNKNRQNQMATRWSNARFDNLNKDALEPKTRGPENVSKVKTGTQPQYTPRTKPVQPANPGRAQLLALADAANSAWPQRGLLASITNASTKEAVADLVEREVRYLGSIRSTGKTLYPNQQEYMRRLFAIAQHLSK